MTDHHDRETVVVERDRGSGLGSILGIVLIVALLAAIWYFTMGPGAGTREQGGTDTNVTTPSLEAPAMGSQAPAGS